MKTLIYTIRVHKENGLRGYGRVKVFSGPQFLEVLARAKVETGVFYEIEEWYSERKFKSGYTTSTLPSQRPSPSLNDAMGDCCFPL